MKYHSCHHYSQRPDIQRVMVKLIRHQKLRTLKIPRTHPHVIILLRQIKLPESPVDNSEFPIVMVDDDVAWFDIPVHYPLGMAVVQS